MPVLQEDRARYDEFIEKQLKTLKSVDFYPEKTLWHYTSGTGLLGIIESGALFATQVACLNDSTEVRYASAIFRDALVSARKKHSGDAQIDQLLQRITDELIDDPSKPTHAPSWYFVACFSEHENDLSQWRAYCGGENGYAIGFRAGGLFGYPNSLVAQVNYNRDAHLAVAEQIAEATVCFYRDGLDKHRAASPEAWVDEFLPVWMLKIEQLAPLVKDHAFEAEKEYRVVHQLQNYEMCRLRFKQKDTLMSRYLPMQFPQAIAPRLPMLPIVGVKVGPTRHKEISRISVNTLLVQMGYGPGKVSVSDIPFQKT